MTLHDGLRVGLALGAPAVTVAVGVVALMTTTGGTMPTVPQFAGFVALNVAMLTLAALIIPRIGSGA